MGAKLTSALRSVLTCIGEGLAWTGWAWSGMSPPYEWTQFEILPPDQPYLTPLSEQELAVWAVSVKHPR